MIAGAVVGGGTGDRESVDDDERCDGVRRMPKMPSSTIDAHGTGLSLVIVPLGSASSAIGLFSSPVRRRSPRGCTCRPTMTVSPAVARVRRF